MTKQEKALSILNYFRPFLVDINVTSRYDTIDGIERYEIGLDRKKGSLEFYEHDKMWAYLWDYLNNLDEK